MLFSSWPFIAVFLPVVWLGYRMLVAKGHHRHAMLWLTAGSLFFYGWFRWDYLLIIIASILFNYSVGNILLATLHRGRSIKRNLVLCSALAANLGALFYYKYTGLFISTWNDMTAGTIDVPQIVLPVGISFFTFQSIGWLVDAYRGQGQRTTLADYTLFITFFPQLIAGPIVHHREMMPQFRKPLPTRQRDRLLAVGITVFAIGLFKKVVIADHMGEIADPIFNTAAAGAALSVIEAWLGTLSYTLQIYFDFSGYSDMAIGLGAMFGIRLPLNFFSPYKSADIITFWRRWHITLSRFLRDYLYIPLGGNRHGGWRRHGNLMITMLLGGLWHGANWTFLVWGGLHGVYLVSAHLWRRLVGWRMPRAGGIFLTFIAVSIAWVFFRAADFDTALRVLQGMTGANGLALQDHNGWLADLARAAGFDVSAVGHNRNLRINEKWYIFWLALLSVFVLPSTHEIMRGRVALDLTGAAQGARSLVRYAWHPRTLWAVLTVCMFGLSMTLLTRVNAFIYFQF